MNADNELDQLKRHPLQDVLIGLGFIANKRKSSRQSCFLEHPELGLKFVVSRNTNGHYRFFPIGSNARGGTVVDALAILGYSIGQVRQYMRPLINKLHPIQSTSPQLSPRLQPTSSDIEDVRRRFWQSAIPIADGVHDYLNSIRQLSSSLLSRSQFSKTIFTDARSNAVFPQYDRLGEIVGASLRNRDFKGQLKGGKKTLWFATPGRAERKNLLIAESEIDACSYAQLHYSATTCYVSTGGQISPLQREYIASAIQKLPVDADGVVTIATDNDQAGCDAAANLKAIFESVCRDDLRLNIHQPPKTDGWKDWNDVLVARSPGS